MKQEFPLSMVDVIPLLGLPTPPRGKSNYYVKCPCCDTNGKHLNINFTKNAFRCPRCGFSGGVLDLYSAFTGVPRARAFKSVAEGLQLDLHDPAANLPKRNIIQQAARMSVLTDVITRDATYRALLSKLSLAEDHHQNLLGRGLTDEVIEKCGYRTSPVLGYKTIAIPTGYMNQIKKTAVAAELLKRSGVEFVVQRFHSAAELSRSCNT